MNMTRSLSNSLLRAVHDDVALYPAVTIIDGSQKLRTPWEDGWNEAVISLTKQWNEAITWFKGLDDTHQVLLERMLDAGAVELSYDDTWSVMVNTNDFFGYGADCEVVEVRDLPSLHHSWEQYGQDGVMAWVAHTRQTDPLPKRQSQKYLQARQALNFYAHPPSLENK